MQLGQMYPNRFLRGQDMAGRILIVIRGVQQEKVRAGAGKPEESKWVLRFELAKANGNPTVLPTTQHPPEGYGLILRKTLAAEIFEATHTTDTNDWPACQAVIRPETERAAGRDVVTIHASAPRKAQPAPAPTSTLAQAETTPEASNGK